MSLAINPEEVTAVLLADGIWYEVAKGSFDTDAYEFLQRWENPPGYKKTLLLYNGGTGFMFQHPSGSSTWFFGPIESVKAVKVTRVEGESGNDLRPL